MRSCKEYDRTAPGVPYICNDVLDRSGHCMRIEHLFFAYLSERHVLSCIVCGELAYEKVICGSRIEFFKSLYV